MAEDGIFNKTTGNAFVNVYDTVRGYVRERLVQQRLAPHLPAAPCKIIDVGGGDGRDACWLAGLGHQVVLVDSKDMVDKAETNVNNASKSVQRNVVCVVGTDKTALEQYGPNEFDILLRAGSTRTAI